MLLGLENRAGCIFFTSSQCFWMALTLQNLKLVGNLEFSWYSQCNILRYCSNRWIVWFFIPANWPAQANRKFPDMLKSKFSLSRHFEYANEQITYHFWLWSPCHERLCTWGARAHSNHYTTNVVSIAHWLFVNSLNSSIVWVQSSLLFKKIYFIHLDGVLR